MNVPVQVYSHIYIYWGERGNLKESRRHYADYSFVQWWKYSYTSDVASMQLLHLSSVYRNVLPREMSHCTANCSEDLANIRSCSVPRFVSLSTRVDSPTSCPHNPANLVE